jgi:hypothetical protein
MLGSLVIVPRSLIWLGTATVVLIACAAVEPRPAPAPSTKALTEQELADGGSAPPLVAPPPSYGNRVAAWSPEERPNAEARAARDEQEPRCVSFWPEVRYRNYGYDHIVHLDSRCELTVLCEVWSDVNPEPSDVTVPPRGHVEVLSFRGSPARQFTPKVTCRLRA